MVIESWQIWTLIGGIPAVISAIIGAIWLLTSKKIILNWTSKENQKLEEIKGEISRNNSIISDLINTQSSAYLAAHGKRLKAIEELWDTYLIVKKSFPAAIFLMYTILTKEEIEQVLNDHDPKHTIPPLIRNFNAKDYSNKLLEATEKIDQYRIYIDPNLWNFFFIYRAFCGRLAFWIDKGKKQNKIEVWTEEKQIKDLLKVIFSDDEIKHIYQMKVGTLQYVFDLIEIKILNEITELTTGTKQSKLNIEQILEINRLLSITKLNDA